MLDFTGEDFGPDFVWGAATAAYQVEGAHDQDGRGPSIWDTFTHRPRWFGPPRATGDVACDFYYHYEADLHRLKQMGFTAFRFSIAWSRIMPQGTGRVNEPGLAFYDRLIDTCLKLGIEPWITLYHWDLPQALEDKGGWTNRLIIRWFSDFVDCCTKAFGHKVNRWMVLNEPTAFTVAGYFAGVHAPGRRGIDNFMRAAHHAVVCQGEGGRIIRRNVPGAKIGTTFFCAPVDARTASLRDQRAASRVNALGNRLFIEPALGLGYPTQDAPLLEHLLKRYVQPGDMERATFDFDFIGLQNYFRMVVRHSWFTPYVWARQVRSADQRSTQTTQMDWEVYPDGIYRIIRQFSQYENVKEIVITENGAAFPDVVEQGAVNDGQRVDFYRRYLREVLRGETGRYHYRGVFCVVAAG